MKKDSAATWSIKDLIDFEILVKDDRRLADSGAVDLRDRDSRFYRDLPSDSGAKSTNKSFLFHRWLTEQRRKRFPDGESIGEEVVSLFKLMAIGLFVAGFVSAVALVTFLSNGGASGEDGPDVNITYFNVVCIVFPLLLTLFGYWGVVASRFQRLPKLPAFLRGFYAHLLEPFLRWLSERIVSQDTSLKAASVRGAIISQLKSRKGVLSLCISIWIQLFGLGYGVGLPVSSYFNLKFVSHDYGWQTSLESSPETLFERVSFYSLPWSWWKGEGIGYPSLQQVEITEYTKRDPLVKQPKEAWTAWSWFLILAGISYVAMPRLLLFWLSLRNLRLSLANETFDNPLYDSLYERMLWKPVGWGVGGEDTDSDEEVEEGEISEVAEPEGQSVKEIPDVCLFVVPEDSSEPEIIEAATEFIGIERHWKITDTLIIPETEEGRDSFLSDVGSLLPEGGAHRVILLEEIQVAPVLERIQFLKDLRKAIGEKPGIVVALLGLPSEKPLGNAAPKVKLTVWEESLRALGDPHLRVVTFES